MMNNHCTGMEYSAESAKKIFMTDLKKKECDKNSRNFESHFTLWKKIGKKMV